MRFWWVNHSQTHREEILGGYIRCPQRRQDGRRQYNWTNLTLTTVCDTIFSHHHGQIGAIGIVASDCETTELGDGLEQARDGWIVKIGWCKLQEPIYPRQHTAEIAPLLPPTYSPLNGNMVGNMGYLYEISDQLGEVLLRIARTNNGPVVDGIDDCRNSILEDEESSRIERQQIPETEKNQLIKARRGQGVFRERVKDIENVCRLTGVNDERFLIASHIKPWRVSDDTEKLDGNNGLLLSPHVDKLFDKGCISFSDNGDILCANGEAVEIMHQWCLDTGMNVGAFRAEQMHYLQYHRENVYRTPAN